MSPTSSSSYIALRDDSGLKSLSTAESSFIRSCANRQPQQQSLRLDGRSSHHVRSHKLQLIRRESGSSATVQWGTTKVTCTCTAEIVTPLPDRPLEGMVRIAVDLSPMASTRFRWATPASTTGNVVSQSNRALPPPDSEQKLLLNRILRCLERIVLLGGTLDTEALCITVAKHVWMLQLSLIVLDHGGNLFDASMMACMAALRHYRSPHIELSPELKVIHPDVREPTPLPLHHTPLSISFALIRALDEESTHQQQALMIDPDVREELVSRGTVTIAMNVHGQVCLLDYGGGSELTLAQIRQCLEQAHVAVPELCRQLEHALTEADQQAQSERLQRLQRQQYSIPPLPLEVPTGIPFFQGLDETLIERDVQQERAIMDEAATAAKEAYKRQALDYNRGHAPSKLRTDDKDAPSVMEAQSLLVSMLQWAKGGTAGVTDQEAIEMTPDTPAQPMDTSAQLAEESAARRVASVEQLASSSLLHSAEAASTARLDSDEEETTIELTSEYAPAPVPTPTKAQPEPSLDDDVDDLRAAIKKKPKKGRKAN